METQAAEQTQRSCPESSLFLTLLVPLETPGRVYFYCWFVVSCFAFGLGNFFKIHFFSMKIPSLFVFFLVVVLSFV